MFAGRIAAGKVAEMLLEMNEFMEESFDRIIKNLEKNTNLLEKAIGELTIIKKYLNLE